jgi:hypothetical protein
MNRDLSSSPSLRPQTQALLQAALATALVAALLVPAAARAQALVDTDGDGLPDSVERSLRDWGALVGWSSAYTFSPYSDRDQLHLCASPSPLWMGGPSAPGCPFVQGQVLDTATLTTTALTGFQYVFGAPVPGMYCAKVGVATSGQAVWYCFANPEPARDLHLGTGAANEVCGPDYLSGAPLCYFKTPRTFSTNCENCATRKAGDDLWLTVRGAYLWTSGEPAPAVTVGGVPCKVDPASLSAAGDGLRCKLYVKQLPPASAEVRVSATKGTAIGQFYAPPPKVTAVHAPVAVLPLAGGVQLTVDGFGLDFPDLQLTVGGQPCPVGTRSLTRATCTAPAGRGTGVPVVARAGDMHSYPYTVTVDYAPSMVALLTGSGPERGGNPVQLAVVGLPGYFSVSIGGVDCPVEAVSTSTPAVVTCSAPAGRGAQLVTVLSPSGNTAEPFAYQYIPAPQVFSVSPPAGPERGGQQLTLGGAAFAGSGTVTIGGSPCLVLSWSDTSITCATPAGTGEGLVVVTSGTQQSQSPAVYAWLPPPVITSVTLPVDPALAGTIALQGLRFGPGLSIAVNGADCSVLSSSETQATCALPAGQAFGAVVVTTLLGGSSAPFLLDPAP